MNLQTINFEDLKNEYFERTRGQMALKFFAKAIKTWKPMQLGRLLRYHYPLGVYDRRQIRQRSMLDDLLNGCSVLEIAAQVGFIEPPDQQEFWLNLRQILENRQVAKYFIKHYPLPLPQLLLMRLKGANAINLERRAEQTTWFLEFLALDQRFRRNHDNNDPDNLTFLDLLDDYYFEDYDFDSFVDDLMQPLILVQSVLLPPAKRKRSHRMMNEFTQFIQFAFDLLDLLQRMHKSPLFQSAVWHHYGYWFGIIGDDLSEDLGKAIKQFGKWKPNHDKRATTKQIKNFMMTARRTILDLTSQRFKAPVNRLLKVKLMPVDAAADPNDESAESYNSIVPNETPKVGEEDMKYRLKLIEAFLNGEKTKLLTALDTAASGSRKVSALRKLVTMFILAKQRPESISRSANLWSTESLLAFAANLKQQQSVSAVPSALILPYVEHLHLDVANPESLYISTPNVKNIKHHLKKSWEKFRNQNGPSTDNLLNTRTDINEAT